MDTVASEDRQRGEAWTEHFKAVREDGNWMNHSMWSCPLVSLVPEQSRLLRAIARSRTVLVLESVFLALLENEQFFGEMSGS